MLSNIPLSTKSPPGEKAWLLLPKLAFSVSIRRSNGSSGRGAMGKEPSVALLVVEGIVNGGAVAFSSLFRTSGIMGAAAGENRSSDRGDGTRPSSGKTSCFQGLWLVSMSTNEASRFA